MTWQQRRIHNEIQQRITDIVEIEQVANEKFEQTLLRLLQVAVQSRKKSVVQNNYLKELNQLLAKQTMPPISEETFESIETAKAIDGLIFLVLDLNNSWRIGTRGTVFQKAFRFDPVWTPVQKYVHAIHQLQEENAF